MNSSPPEMQCRSKKLAEGWSPKSPDFGGIEPGIQSLREARPNEGGGLTLEGRIL